MMLLKVLKRNLFTHNCYFLTMKPQSLILLESASRPLPQEDNLISVLDVLSKFNLFAYDLLTLMYTRHLTLRSKELVQNTNSH